jgi:hypothetical protein
MLQFLILLLFLSLHFLAISQQPVHTLYLRDGTIFVGEILEITAGGFYRVRTASGAELFFNETDK